ncbi:hypothetical protein MNEG_0671 [Monoraphidium neglectum]|uniref:Uncharacterized protein n=1 Tax=Monoraphidium neglectum TaxID=145388 RepID=A0A0D2NSS8_9CHLO|nr:hypothetical protein MNEG_0671 [Monoraphidium neglectum]KIZ07276.1 hypothetical protein MNEG_0671 [Monoraphidium neglectum]|eukprot:XP_013906295.1 hypothetical protein MNEG_0671 [Monoraphidium neglectum]
MSFAAKAAKAVAERAAPLAGTAAVLAAQPVAQAREAHQAGPSSALSQIARIQDEFELVDFEGTKPIFSRPIFADDEITLAAQAFRTLVSVEDEPDTDTSEGAIADAFIEAPPFGLPASAAPRPALVDIGMLDLRQEEMRAALQVANRVLRHPGVQREMAAAALSDPEVLSILGARPDLDGYLVARGFAARGLLPGGDGTLAEAAVVEEAGAEAGGGDAGAAAQARAGERDPLAQALANVVRGLEWTGARIADLHAWLRGRFAPPSEAAAAEEVAAAGREAKMGTAAAAGEGSSRRERRRPDPWRVLERAGQVAVVLVLLILFRRAGRA